MRSLSSPGSNILLSSIHLYSVVHIHACTRVHIHALTAGQITGLVTVFKHLKFKKVHA